MIMLRSVSEFLVIRPSNVISSLCYSIFRIEPYSQCFFNCVYCYAKWYRASESLSPLRSVVHCFELVARKLRRLKLPIIPFRLSTLIEPFQPIELKYKLSKRVLSICLKYKVPIVISTKSILIRESSWRELVLKLAEKDLVVVQVSLSSLIDKISKLLEPVAPLPHERLNLAERLAGENVPVVIRYQPFIPHISDCEDLLLELVSDLKSIRVSHLIVESLRISQAEFEHIKRLLVKRGLWHNIMWESYGVREESFFLKPSISRRHNVYRKLRQLCDKYSVKFATCKEGYYDLWTAEDCCGFYALDPEKTRYRITLREFWELSKKLSSLPSYSEVMRKLGKEKYLHSANVSAYPRIVRRGIKSHERRLLKVTSDFSLLDWLTGNSFSRCLVKGKRAS